MKKLKYIMSLLMLMLILVSCSGVKVVNAWKNENGASMKDRNILVIARTQNKQARIAFEEEIANQLRSTGHKATESFKKFPKLNPDEQMTAERQEMIRTILDSEGYNGVVLTVIKDIQESQVTTSSGGYYSGGSYGGYYPSYYGGFYGYYNHPMSYSTYGNYMDATTTTYTSTTYILETVVYNLDEEEGNELFAVVTSQIEDPSNVTRTAEAYVQKVVAALKEK